jgi:hypothetical protein
VLAATEQTLTAMARARARAGAAVAGAAIAAAAAATAALEQHRRLGATGERHHQDNTVHFENLLLAETEPTHAIVERNERTKLPGAYFAKIVKLGKIAK